MVRYTFKPVGSFEMDWSLCHQRKVCPIMKCIAGISWNDDERRIRALWRLVAQTCMLILLTLILQHVLVLVFGLVAFVAQPITPWQVDPKATNALFHSWSESFSHAPLFALRFVSTLVCIWLAGRVLDRRQFAGFGLHISRDWLIDLGFGLLLGAFLITSVFLIEVAAGWVIVTGTCETRHADHRFAVAILSGAVTMLLIGAEEELLGRGYQLTNLAEGLNCRCIDPRWSVIIASLLSAALFALMHVGNPHASAISTFSVFMGGIITALGYILTGELAIPIGLHITWNFFQSNVFGFPVSGMDLS
jgi:membrane protease YdiL (CAAX protease family)